METLSSQMNQKVASILEDWAMMMVEPDQVSAASFNEADECYVASLEFRGAVSGVYSVVCQRPFAHALSSTLVGDAGDASSQEDEDALAELVNVISGNMLTTAYGEHVVFALTAPKVEHLPLAQAAERLVGTVLGYRADGEPIAVCFKPLEVSHDH